MHLSLFISKSVALSVSKLSHLERNFDILIRERKMFPFFATTHRGLRQALGP
jgi:hypothetical protein